MKRIKMEVIFHVADTTNEDVFATRANNHMKSYRDPEQSGNGLPHYESCEISVERRTWEKTR